jgi:DNA-binding response OmpR family regulator
VGTIFILDDEEDILFVLNYWLVNAGYEVHVFTNSKDMVRLLDTCMPDIMLLDINLPGEDGREVCKMLRKERHYDKPILHISANRYLYDTGSGSCADGFIAKPFDLKELTKVVDSFLSK